MTEPSLGVVFRPQSPPERLREVALAAEEAGVAELWPVPLRNPALAAVEIATLARMSPGGSCRGWGTACSTPMAQVGARAASPMTLLREHTTAIWALLHGGTVSVDGRYVQLRDVTLDWPPSQVPPLLVGARGRPSRSVPRPASKIAFRATSGRGTRARGCSGDDQGSGLAAQRSSSSSGNGSKNSSGTDPTRSPSGRFWSSGSSASLVMGPVHR